MKGSCQCNTVRYEVDEFASAIVHCHCRTCQKIHSSAFVSTARVARNNFLWLSGEEELSSYESSPGKYRWFCSKCGSHLLAEWLNQHHIILRVVTLDEDPGVTAKAHIWTSHDLPWLKDHDDVISFLEIPKT